MLVGLTHEPLVEEGAPPMSTDLEKAAEVIVRELQVHSQPLPPPVACQPCPCPPAVAPVVYTAPAPPCLPTSAAGGWRADAY